MKTRQPLFVISFIFMFLFACQSLTPSTTALSSPIPNQEAISQPTATVVPTEEILPKPTDIPATPTPLPNGEIIDEYDVPMVFVPEGEFTMGSNNVNFVQAQPVHQVYLDSYYIDKYEVSNKFFKPCVDAGVCRKPSGNSEYGDPAYDSYPVTLIKWDSAKTYCEWRGARLPTEAEWEKAARGTDGQLWPWGNDFDNSLLNNSGEAMPVDSFPQGVSPYGAYNMAGNVAEWVSDWFLVDYYGQSPLNNPQGPDSGTYKILRGGSFNDNTPFMYRRWPYRPDSGGTDFGIRCAKNAKP